VLFSHLGVLFVSSSLANPLPHCLLNIYTVKLQQLRLLIYQAMIIPFYKLVVAMLTPVIIVEAEWAIRECNWDPQCEALYKPGSKCLEGGVCSNPYTGGCLNHFYSHSNQQQSTPKAFLSKRTCNSKDRTREDCEQPALPYHEIRVHNAPWEAAVLYSWIIQIFLSEFLQVPSTVGLNSEDTRHASFYAPNMEMLYSVKTTPWEELITANEMEGRCELTDKDCVHVLPEIWSSQEKLWNEYLKDGHIDQPSGNGQVGKASWYIPVHTAKQYPDLLSYHGLTGQREKLASIFNRPTSWGDYCESYSPTNCTMDDGIALRLPADKDESSRYFQDGFYTGFFRPTEKNDCSLNPDTCSGHIVDSACDWDSDAFVQAYWNDIPLESDGPLPENNGYLYEQMIEVWRAANATQSHVVMFWWTGDPSIEEFRDTPFQFQPILLPEPTAECHASRIDYADRCSPDPMIRRGPEGGGCDNEPFPLQKILASSLRDVTLATPEVDRSPGYQAILNLKVSGLDMNKMLQKYIAGGWSGYAARESVCEWVIDHQEALQSFIPHGYPRVFATKKYYNEPWLYIAIGCGTVAILYVMLAAVIVWRYSTAKVFVYAQVPFVFMVLFGMFLVACGSIFVALEPQDPICVSQKWFIALGYTLELAPLLVKIAAINRVVAATRHMKSVRISMRTLGLKVVALVFVVIVFLTLWTVLDSPERHEERYLQGIDVVATATICASKSVLWDLMVLCWNGVLILCATVLAFQSQNVKEEFNDSKSLGTMIYSHFVFAVLRLVALSFSELQISEDENNGGYPPIEPSTLAAASSVLLSVDVIFAVTIYVVPKLASARKAPAPHHVTVGVTATGRHVSGASNVKSSMSSMGAAHMSAPRSSTILPDQLAHSLPPMGDEGLDYSERNGPPQHLPSGSISVLRISESGHRRVGMDGDIRVEENHGISSDDEDWGGPRFAAPSGAGRAHNSHTAILSLGDEGLVESTRFM
jgi:7 transmembrane sweet-taste receptor of 3 GCPR